MTSLADTVAISYVARSIVPEPVRAQAAGLLNRRLADAIDLGAQCRQARWNVKGIALHRLFDEVHAGIEGYVDLIAERIVQLGGIAEGTVGIAAERSELDEYAIATGDGLVRAKCLGVALAGFGSRMNVAIRELDELEDAGSADMCTGVAQGIARWLWFVEAHLQAR